MLTLIKALPIGAQIGIALAVMAAAGGGYYAWRTSIFNEGAAYEHAQQKERDDEAVAKARAGRNDVRECNDAGGLWDTTRGICDGR